jgi:SAM-dependent methyltransferase
MTDRMPAIFARWYPELHAGGFARDDGDIVFLSRVHALLPAGATVLDFGAGRGRYLTSEVSYLARLYDLRLCGATVIGADVNPAVRDNPGLDEAHVIAPPEAPLPFPDAQFDLVLASYVFEHIREPERCAGELGRVLKPGGWLCARTPNKWGYPALAARIIPDRWHAGFLRRMLKVPRTSADIFPTFYRMNTAAALRRLFPVECFRHCSYIHNGPPSYHGGHSSLAYLFRAYEQLMPAAFGRQLHVFIQKRSASL